MLEQWSPCKQQTVAAEDPKLKLKWKRALHNEAAADNGPSEQNFHSQNFYSFANRASYLCK
jgi:hypothetical protein